VEPGQLRPAPAGAGPAPLRSACRTCQRDLKLAKRHECPFVKLALCPRDDAHQSCHIANPIAR
jgi:hypothetical protein